MATLRQITVFPIKALAGIDLSEVEITDGGTLRRDRELALFDGSGGFVNGKRQKLIHKVGAKYDLRNGSVDLLVDGDRESQRFALEGGQDEIAAFLGELLGIDIEVRALRYCRDLAPVQADALAPLPFVDAAFDAVMMVDILEHLAELDFLVAEVARVLICSI